MITFLFGGKNSMTDVSVTLRPPRRCLLPVPLNNGNAGSGNEIDQARFLKKPLSINSFQRFSLEDGQVREIILLIIC